MTLTEQALALVRESPTYRDDARQGASVGNSVIGSLLALQTGSPRRHTEAAVAEALRLYDREQEQQADTHTLPRTGQAPLSFRGKLLADSDGHWCRSKEQNRYHNLGIYRTPGGKYVVAISYRTHWQGETDHDYAEALATPAAVADALRAYDPTAHVGGYPPGPQFAERQQRLYADLRRRYEAQVSDVLDAEEFAERVE